MEQVFTFKETKQPIRIELVNEEPWFVAKDVCDALGLTEVSNTLLRLDDDEKLIRTLFASGQKRQMWLVNESGLYNLIFQSRKVEAKSFRKWVTSEVLPMLRKTGRYELTRRIPYCSPRNSSFLDLRNQPYETQLLNDYPVRVIVYEDTEWFSLADIQRAIQADTSAHQAARMLNMKRQLAQKIFIFGNTHPAWFTTYTGLRLIISGSRKLKIENRNFKLCKGSERY